jgi:hypothetical protein
MRTNHIASPNPAKSLIVGYLETRASLLRRRLPSIAEIRLHEYPIFRAKYEQYITSTFADWLLAHFLPLCDIIERPLERAQLCC